jgi:hypothetical protein
VRRVLAIVVVALGLAWLRQPTGERVPLRTVEGQTCCLLSYSVVDVIADPISGTPVVTSTGQPLTWVAGHTAWRAGTETEVRDALGNVVLRTPGRFWISPTWPDWVVGEIKRCSDCDLGGGPL